MSSWFVPIFCDNCSGLAMAEFDNAFLCALCLFKAVDLTEEKNAPFKIRPLKLTLESFMEKKVTPIRMEEPDSDTDSNEQTF